MKRILLIMLSTLLTASVTAQTIIKDQPEGELKNLYRQSDAYYLAGEYVYRTHIDGAATYVVKADNGCYYVKNPLSTFPTDTWMKLDPDGEGKLRARLPVTIYQGKAPILGDDGVEEKDIVGEIWSMKVNYYGNSYEPDKSKGFLRFSINDGTIELTDGQVMGLVEKVSREWIGYCDYNTRWEEIKEPQIALPDDIDSRTEDCFISFFNGGLVRDARPTKAAFYDDAAYILMREGTPELWMKACISGNKATINTPQYFGYDDKRFNSHLFAVAADYELQNDDGVWFNYYTMANNDIVFDYDKDKHALTTQDNFLINAGKNDIRYLSDYCQLQLLPLRSVVERPENPKIAYFHRYFVEDGWGLVEFQQAPLTENGEFLDTGKLFFNIYFDDQLVTFWPGEYVYLTEPITDIPLYFTETSPELRDEADFIYEGLGQQVFYYRSNVERIGVQTFFYDNGKRYASDIVYTDGSVVTTVNQPTSKHIDEMEPAVCYDLQGRKTTSPTRGLYIKRQGSSVSKHIVK